MERWDFAMFLWNRLTLEICYEFGNGYHDESDSCDEMFCIKKILMPGTTVIACNRIGGGDPFVFDFHKYTMESEQAMFLADLLEYLTVQGFSDSVWIKTDPVNCFHILPQKFHNKDLMSFMMMVINTTSNGQGLEFFAEDKHEHFCIRRELIGNTALFVAVSCHRGGEVFSFEFTPKNLTAVYDRFFTQFGEYLAQHGFSDAVLYRRCS